MNRRTFLKITGMASLLGISNITLGQKEQKWISLMDKKPKIGQRVAVVSYGSPDKKRNWDHSDYMLEIGYRLHTRESRFTLLIDFYYANYSNWGRFIVVNPGPWKIRGGEFNKWEGNDYKIKETIMKQAYNLKLKNGETVAKQTSYYYTRSSQTAYVTIHKNIWWIPISHELTESLPLIPKCYF